MMAAGNDGYKTVRLGARVSGDVGVAFERWTLPLTVVPVRATVVGRNLVHRVIDVGTHDRRSAAAYQNPHPRPTRAILAYIPSGEAADAALRSLLIRKRDAFSTKFDHSPDT